jgi:hypothetical protein
MESEAGWREAFWRDKINKSLSKFNLSKTIKPGTPKPYISDIAETPCLRGRLVSPRHQS